MSSQFLTQIPDLFLESAEASEWARGLHLFLDEITRPDGTLDQVGTTTEVVLTHSEKLDLVTVTATIDLDTIATDTAANKAALAGIQDSLPAYSISNDGTDRVFNADAAAGTITSPPTQAEVENIRDSLLELADVVATVIRDLKDKDIFGI